MGETQRDRVLTDDVLNVVEADILEAARIVERDGVSRAKVVLTVDLEWDAEQHEVACTVTHKQGRAFKRTGLFRRGQLCFSLGAESAGGE